MKPDGPAVRALLLDLDGTLAASLGVMEAVYGRFLRAHGAVPSSEEFRSLNGPQLAEVVARLRRRHDLGEAHDVLLGHYEALVDEAYREIAPGPGAATLLTRAARAQVRTGVVTSNSRARTQAWLERTGFADRVAFVVGGEDVRLGKPDPEPYRRATALSGCAPEAIVAVEDSDAGVASALAAGLRAFRLAVAPHSGGPPDGAETIASLDELAAHLWPAGTDLSEDAAPP